MSLFGTSLKWESQWSTRNKAGPNWWWLLCDSNLLVWEPRTVQTKLWIKCFFSVPIIPKTAQLNSIALRKTSHSMGQNWNENQKLWKQTKQQSNPFNSTKLPLMETFCCIDRLLKFKFDSAFGMGVWFQLPPIHFHASDQVTVFLSWVPLTLHLSPPLRTKSQEEWVQNVDVRGNNQSTSRENSMVAKQPSFSGSCWKIDKANKTKKMKRGQFRLDRRVTWKGDTWCQEEQGHLSASKPLDCDEGLGGWGVPMGRWWQRQWDYDDGMATRKGHSAFIFAA